MVPLRHLQDLIRRGCWSRPTTLKCNRCDYSHSYCCPRRSFSPRSKRGNTRHPPQRWNSIRERYEIASGRRSVTATLEQLRIEGGEFARPSQVSWRIAIWAGVIDEWNSSWTNRLFGIGFGTEIEAMPVPGRQGFDGLNRSVHSIAFTVLTRQGLVGIAAASALLLALASARPLSRAITTPTLTTAIVVGLFDAFLEGVQAPIVLWTLVGLMSNEQRSSQRSSISSKSAT